MKTLSLFCLTFSALVLLTSCANTDDALQRETAKSVGDVAPGSVTLSNINRGAMTVKWQANTPKGAYECSGDDMLRSVVCAKSK